MMRWLLLGLLGVCFTTRPVAPLDEPEETPEPEPPIVEILQAEAKRMAGFVREPVGRQFVAASAHLPSAAARTIYKRSDGAYVSPYELKKLSDEERKRFSAVELPPKSYYLTRYGTPLAYGRALDLVGNRSGWSDLRGKKVLDFGYGGIGHLRMLAACGSNAVGVDVDSFLEALYSKDSDQGVLEGVPDGGKVRLVRGRWPATEEVRKSVGSGYDLFITKNTLKHGYIHPERPTEKRLLVDLGVSDEEYVKHLFEILNPGGWVMIYNLYPPQNPPEERYIPWATGRCPFDRALVEKAGFRVVNWNEDDTAAARQMAERLAWEMSPESLFAMFTILQKPASP